MFAVVVAVDQATKAAASLLGSVPLIRPVTNPRFSLGLAGTSLPLMILISALGIITFGTYLVWASVRGDLAPWVPSFLLGGAVSNLSDRVIGGAVRDFVGTLGVVWNVADLAVLLGMLGYAWMGLTHVRARESLA